MIKTEGGNTEIKVTSPMELFGDVLEVITTFVAYSKSIQVPDETIEQTLVKMIVDAFNDSDGKDLIDLSDKE